MEIIAMVQTTKNIQAKIKEKQEAILKAKEEVKQKETRVKTLEREFAVLKADFLDVVLKKSGSELSDLEGLLELSKEEAAQSEQSWDKGGEN
jgi:hypothetical protein